MVTKTLKRSIKRLLSGNTPVVLLTLLLLVSLYLLSSATHQSTRFGELYILLLAVNSLAIVTLVGLIARYLGRLRRQYRENAPGSRLTVRLVVMLVTLSVTPVSVVYLFSLDFLQRGIDSWFDVRVEKALDDALELSKASLGIRMRNLLNDSQDMARQLVDTPSDLTALTLNDLREQSNATELTLFNTSGLILASSSQDPDQFVPQGLDDTSQMQIRQGNDDVSLLPVQDKGLFIRTTVNVRSAEPGTEDRVLRVMYPVTERVNTLADSVQVAFGRYRELAYLRKPLKYSFILALSLVLFLSVLTAVLAALFSSRRLVAPIRDLAEGTRAVAEGNYAKRLPLPGKDELGFLVRSFNDMTRRISMAQKEARKSQRQAEEQQSYLEAVLANLSSGVLTLDTDLNLKTSNTVAGQMLGLDLTPYYGRQLIDIVDDHTHLQFLMDSVTPHLSAGEQEWTEEVIQFGPGGRKVYIWRGTHLKSSEEVSGGHVIVFDDITALMQAQRDAAWGEVARRLAHEIKNPLTPIQLSAERLRHKYLSTMDSADADVLDRSTRTIVQQVENLKEMVKAFSDYARMPRLHMEPVDINQLVYEVTDLYDEGEKQPRFQIELDEALPFIEADDNRLRQLLNNLIKNALEAVDYQPPSPIQISTHCMREANCNFIELRIRDSGPGIPEDMLPHLFEPYVTTKPKGTGLGLAIVKKIVEEHGGIVWAENAAGGGASMVIRLPVSREKSDSHKPGNGIRIRETDVSNKDAAA